MSRTLRAQPLERATFAAFGDVIETDHAQHYPINAGWATRYNDLARLDVTQQQGRPALSIFRALARPKPMPLQKVERHLLASQAFVPLTTTPFLVVVAPAGLAPNGPDDLLAFVTNGRQGVNYRPGVWHHPLLAIEQTCDFLIVDRIGASRDCEELEIDNWDLLLDW